MGQQRLAADDILCGVRRVQQQAISGLSQQRQAGAAAAGRSRVGSTSSGTASGVTRGARGGPQAQQGLPQEHAVSFSSWVTSGEVCRGCRTSRLARTGSTLRNGTNHKSNAYVKRASVASRSSSRLQYRFGYAHLPTKDGEFLCRRRAERKQEKEAELSVRSEPSPPLTPHQTPGLAVARSPVARSPAASPAKSPRPAPSEAGDSPSGGAPAAQPLPQLSLDGDVLDHCLQVMG